MNSNIISGKWQQLKGDIKAKWSKLTDDDLQMLQGKRQRLIGKIVERYGVLQEEARQQVDEWAQTLGKKLDAFSDDVDDSTDAAKRRTEARKADRAD